MTPTSFLLQSQPSHELRQKELCAAALFSTSLVDSRSTDALSAVPPCAASKASSRGSPHRHALTSSVTSTASPAFSANNSTNLMLLLPAAAVTAGDCHLPSFAARDASTHLLSTEAAANGGGFPSPGEQLVSSGRSYGTVSVSDSLGDSQSAVVLAPLSDAESSRRLTPYTSHASSQCATPLPEGEDTPWTYHTGHVVRVPCPTYIQGEVTDTGASNSGTNSGSNARPPSGAPPSRTGASTGAGEENAPSPNAPLSPGAGQREPLQSPPVPPPDGPVTILELILHRVRTTSLLQFLWVVLLVVMLMTGNAFQVIFLNFWIHQFPKEDAGSSSSSSGNSSGGTRGGERAQALDSSYTTFIISACAFAVFFIILFVLYWFVRRPNLQFARDASGWKLLLGIGAMDALNSGLAIYAAAHTPEMLQALFVSLVPIYSAFFTKWLLKDPRNYANTHVVVSFALIVAGVALASVFSYAATHDHADSSSSSDGGSSGSAASSAGVIGSFITAHAPAFISHYLESDASATDTPTTALARDKQLWCLLFFLSVPPTVLMNVWQTLYMIRYTHSDDLTVYLLEHEGEAEDTTVSSPSGRVGEYMIVAETPEQQQQQPGRLHHQHRLHVPASDLVLHGEDTTVKLVMLAADTTIQALIGFLMMPVDAAPWFGGSSSLHEVWTNLDDGIDCVLHCPRNMRYCVLYSLGFVLVYIASAYLNRYSVTLCSMVSQLSGPITAIILILFPALNITGNAAPWYVSVFAIVLLACGTVIYVYWDEMTGEEKAKGEMQLKWGMMEKQARRQSSAQGSESPDEEDEDGALAPPSQQRRSRSRRYRQRARSDFVVVVDQIQASPAHRTGDGETQL